MGVNHGEGEGGGGRRQGEVVLLRWTARRGRVGSATAVALVDGAEGESEEGRRVAR
ncbi:hypothetical protein LguiA_003048 [Lonicera macranthoides]